jgi:D-glycero-D-manno-heptose 1,7-bisphosphate phosphatase
MEDIAAFLDRDGTIIEDIPYLSNPDEVSLLPGAGSAIARLNRSGIKTIMITNQSGIARGYYTTEIVEAIHERLRGLLAMEGAFLDAIYYCPHLPPEMIGEEEDPCDCRKPELGLVYQAQRDHKINLDGSFFLGDRLTDMELARRIGGVGILVETGYGPTALEEYGTAIRDFHICKALPEAVTLLLSLRSASR